MIKKIINLKKSKNSLSYSDRIFLKIGNFDLTFRYDQEFLQEYYQRYCLDVADTSKLPPLEQITPSTENYQNILMDYGILRNVNLLGCNQDEAKEIYQAVVRCLSYFPALRKYVHFFGTKQGFYQSIDQLYDDKIADRFCLGFIKKERRNDIKEILKQYVKYVFIERESMIGGNIYGIALHKSRFANYAFIDENDITKDDVKRYYQEKYYDELNSLCSSPGAFVTVHELMHLLDAKYYLSSEYEIREFIRKLDQNDYKKQIRFNDNLKEEKFANIMARYICSNNKPPISKQLFDIVNYIINKNK